MMKSYRNMVHTWAILLAIGASILQNAPAKADRITVFAAVSLSEVLTDISDQFQRDTGHQVTISFASSSLLARQISLKAPADLFISANVMWMDYLAQHDLIDRSSRRIVAGNRLVIVKPRSPEAVSEIETIDQLQSTLSAPFSMALSDSVPAGQYAKQALQRHNLWDTVKGHAVQTDNVRAALALVTLGETPHGIVYESDTITNPRLAITFKFPEESHSPIQYPAALTNTKKTEVAKAFLAFLTSPYARTTFTTYGFTSPQSKDTP